MNVTVLGELARGRAIGRAGAKPGDGIYVTGVLGEAQLGLELLLRTKNGPRHNRKLLAHHLYPTLPLDFALWLGRNQVPTAMMDISDGLSTDLTRLCKASGVGARIYSDQIPAVAVPISLQKRPSLHALTLALHGGEDYGLLFTARRRIASRIPLDLWPHPYHAHWRNRERIGSEACRRHREERQYSSQAVGTILQRLEAMKKGIQQMDGRARTNCGGIVTDRVSHTGC